MHSLRCVNLDMLCKWKQPGLNVECHVCSSIWDLEKISSCMKWGMGSRVQMQRSHGSPFVYLLTVLWNFLKIQGITPQKFNFIQVLQIQFLRVWLIILTLMLSCSQLLNKMLHSFIVYFLRHYVMVGVKILSQVLQSSDWKWSAWCLSLPLVSVLLIRKLSSSSWDAVGPVGYLILHSPMKAKLLTYLKLPDTQLSRLWNPPNKKKKSITASQCSLNKVLRKEIKQRKICSEILSLKGEYRTHMDIEILFF